MIVDHRCPLAGRFDPRSSTVAAGPRQLLSRPSHTVKPQVIVPVFTGFFNADR